MKNVLNRIQIIIFVIAYIGVLVLNTTGCSDSEDTKVHNWSISLESKNHVIDKRVGNIGFKFCLLNEDSIPSKIFKTDENIYFYLAIKNYSKEEINIDAESFYKDYFLVYDIEKGTLIGKPYTGMFCYQTLQPHVVSIPGKQTKVFILSWIMPFELDYSVPFYFNFEYDAPYSFPFCGYQDSLLKEDIYSCRFEMDLHYRVGGTTRDGYGFLKDGKEKRISDLFFEINFKVE